MKTHPAGISILLTLCLAKPSKDTELVDEVLDVVESGLSSSEDRRSRTFPALVHLTLSQTSTETVSTTLTRTITNSCVAGTFTECSDDTTTQPPADSGPFPDAIVTLINGTIVNITEILPTRSLREGRSEEGILEEDLGMQSGRISWDEVEEQESKRKPRLIAVLGELMTDTATATMREVATATETVTFNVKLDHCTSAGFMFDQPLCS